METIKNVEVFLPAHLGQFAKHLFPADKNGRLKVHNIVLLAHTNTSAPISIDKKIPIPVSMYRPTEQAKYALARYIRALFHLEMNYMVQAYQKAGLGVKEGIVCFLDKYNIDDDMYKQETAYRMFYKKTKKHDK